MHGEHKSKKRESDGDEVKNQPVSFLDVGVVSAACTSICIIYNKKRGRKNEGETSTTATAHPRP